MNGIVLVDKKPGMTSHDVVNQARKILKTKRIGHTGTLDPFASGLLILLVNDATKLAFLFNGLDKEYQGTILFGKKSDTFDLTGNIEDALFFSSSEKDIDDKMSSFVGKYMQYPPIYSAKKIAGKKLYQYARENKDIEIAPSEVTIKSFKRLSPIIDNKVDFMASVSSGTYIRSLAVDLAEKLGTSGLLQSLRRVKIGNYTLDKVVLLDELNENSIIQDRDLFKEISESVVLDDYEVKLVLNGVKLDERQIKTDKPFLAYDKKGKLVGYFEVSESKEYKLKYLFKDNYENN
ncbi:tRNA pseudouridine(55) synthase TruB [Acholeplasma sp. OttesenSCG-928-E16]|nr:tRNA pseudouridine(55) synthase TruB [Acholeplasma sp. OttesenSCG-928-E16]